MCKLQILYRHNQLTRVSAHLQFLYGNVIETCQCGRKAIVPNAPASYRCTTAVNIPRVVTPLHKATVSPKYSYPWVKHHAVQEYRADAITSTLHGGVRLASRFGRFTTGEKISYVGN